MAALNETRNVGCEAGLASQGLLVKMSDTDGLVEIATAKGDLVVGVTAAESSRDADSALEAPGTVAVYPLSGIVYIKYGETVAGGIDFGAPIYVDDTVDGHCTHNLDTSGKLLGNYFGESNLALTSGDLIPVACGRWS
ncbi:MAG: hypothetical protein GOVbin709_10 [Prokaryotic dsDNA virus sp.]|nr:MAG: hypothetical protein GOVbin709_10 [Prokaryotic dsDNA virus sp.]|tara:strand:+ start:7296 stop:7709 length:414 start_codon:yes stop_codon:yes gene_type:complete